MADFEGLVREEVAATIQRAGFNTLESVQIDIDVTPTFRRKLGECRKLPAARESRSRLDFWTEPETPNRYTIRIAKRLFENGAEDLWRDTVRHEVAHAAVMERYGSTIRPHGPEWRLAAHRAGANPTARYESDASHIDADYVLSCPNECFERPYLKRSKRIKHPSKYRCGSCKKRLISYDAGTRPNAPQPGRCYVSNLH